MRRTTLALLGSGIITLSATAGLAQAPTTDTEGVMTERFGFSAADLAQVRAGQTVTKTAPIEGANMAVFGAMISYAFQGISFILLRKNMPNIERPYRSPLGIPGAAGVLRVDIAHGLRDGADALTIGWQYQPISSRLVP